MKKPEYTETIEELILDLKLHRQFMPMAEDNVDALMLSTHCVICADLPTGEDTRARYIFKGNGLCKIHFEQEKNKV